MTERHRIRLFLRRTQNGIGPGPRTYVYPVVSPEPRWCLGCGQTIPAEQEHAREDNSVGRICTNCVENADAVDGGSEPVARIRVSPDVMRTLMDGAADQITAQRVTTLAIEWDPSLPAAEVERLSRGWARTISDKPVVTMTRVRVYGDRRLEVEA